MTVETGTQMVEVGISDQIKEAASGLRLGVLTCSVTVTPSDNNVQKILNNISSEFTKGLDTDTIKDIPEIRSFRSLYKNLGKDPSRYRPSSEMLLRRLVQGKGMYSINNVVDLLNSVSIETRYPMGFYDLDNLKGRIILRVGHPGESFPGIRKDDVNVESLPVFADDMGPFGSPTSDSARSMIKDETKNLMVIILAFPESGEKDVIEAGERTKKLLEEFASGKNFLFRVV